MRETERRERDRQGRREGDSNTQSETETGRLRKTVREYKGHRSSVYIYIYDLVPKGMHARGYATQLKIKHC